MSREEGVLSYEKGDYNQALDHFLLEDIDPSDDVELAYYLGLCYTRLNEFETAQFYFNRILEADFNIVRVYQSRMILSYIYAVTEQFDNAQYQLEQIIEEGFESPQVFASLGYNSWALGKTDQAINHYRKAIEMDGNNLTSLNSLGYILADEDIDLREAINICQQAVDNNPKNSNYLDSLGWAYYKVGNYKMAQQYLRQAAKIDKNSSVVKQHLSQVEKQLAKN